MKTANLFGEPVKKSQTLVWNFQLFLTDSYLLEDENGHEEYSTVNFHSMDCRAEDEHDGGSGEEGTEGATSRDALGVVDPGGELNDPQYDGEASLEVADDV